MKSVFIKKQIISNNRGFTLLELLVVLILMSIIFGTTLAAGLGWQDWAQFNHEEAMAEEIFYAAQNQLTELDSSGALNRKIAEPLMKTDDIKDGYKTEYALLEEEFNTIIYDKNGNADVTYELKKIWKNTNKSTGNLVRLTAEKDDYKKYTEGTLDTSTAKGLGTKILFDLVSSYVSDTKALNGAIILEFSPDSGQVFSVCYSDRTRKLTYDEVEASEASISVHNRILQERRNIMLGYFSVDSLTLKVKGRGELNASVDLKIDNSETLSLIVEDESGDIGTNDVLAFSIFNGKDSSKVMSFDIPVKDITSASSYKDGLSSAAVHPVRVSVTYSDDSTEDFRIPVFKVGSGVTGTKIYVVLDAADLQAQTLSFCEYTPYFPADTSDTEAAAPADNFKNTYSFYRFGLSKDVNYIYAEAQLLKYDESNMLVGASETVESYDMEGNRHLDDDFPKGECTTFASATSSGIEYIYGIKNARHFYNMRYETDYKYEPDRQNTFNLQADISWADFVNENKGANYFLDSYDTTNELESGINYPGENPGVKLNGNTANLPFPGFRKLDKNDVFTQDVAYGGEGDSYTISDLVLSTAGNITYGIYGDTIKKKCESDQNYTSTQGQPDNSDMGSTNNNAARAGDMPLGLFAENLGTISNLTLNRHVVKGLDIIDGKIVYTCMVGGFAGNNIGSISNLTLLDNVNNNADSDKANKSKVNGRTDVGGIIGRQSFAVSEAKQDVTIEGMKNYATVSGLEYIGGIVGRAYVRYVENSEDALNKAYGNNSSFKYGGQIISSYDQIKNSYFIYHDGYSITDTNKSMTGERVVRNNNITISNCMNRGVVSGDQIAYDHMLYKSSSDNYDKNKWIWKYIIGKNKFSGHNNFREVEPVNWGWPRIKQCACIGGIAGATMDGFIYDDNSFEIDNKGCHSSDLLKAYVDGGSSKISIINCNSYIERLINVSGEGNTITDENNNEIESLKYDCYVGGLVGYAKMTSIKNCNQTPNDIEKDAEDNVWKVFVLGNKFVGGLVGCSDLCKYESGDPSVSSSDGYDGRSYSATNYNNVIGRLFVGGISGAFGEGGRNVRSNTNEIDFRNPSTNFARYASGISAEIIDSDSIDKNKQERMRSALIQNALNTGAVLCLKNTADGNNSVLELGGNVDIPTGYSGYCGGIVGIANMRFSNCDNLQSTSVKQYTLKLINNGEELDITNDFTDDELAEKITDITENSKFGGTRVGGVTGYNCGGVKVNYKVDDKSVVDSVVFGQKMVGGISGDSSDGSYPIACNIYPIQKDSDSIGNVVIGLDYVGGVFGRMGIDIILNNEDGSITSPYTVIGRYVVGGYVGAHQYFSGHKPSRVKTSVELEENDFIKVYGRCYVGGYLGYVSGKQFVATEPATSSVFINNIKIKGDYFVGGLAGAIGESKESKNLTYIKNYKLGENSSVEAICFAGGIAGLYACPSDKNDYEKDLTNLDRKQYVLATSLKYDGSIDDRLYNTYSAVVANDNTANSPFYKGTISSMSYDFGDYGKSGQYTNTTTVKSKLFAGGLFGYVPNDIDLTIEGFVNKGDITVEKSIKVNSDETIGGDTSYSFLGGVVGKVPNNMKVVNCANLASIYTSQGTYMGGLTEVNTGVVSGKYTSAAGADTISNYCINTTSYTRDGSVAAFVGVNGTGVEGHAGTVKYCQNEGAVTSNTGKAAGIAAYQVGTSSISGCINLADITATTKTAVGIVAENSETDTVSICRNYGKINGANNTASYGIAGGNATLSWNLECSGLNTNPIAPSAGTTTNFYVYGDSTGSNSVWYNIDFSTYTAGSDDEEFMSGNDYSAKFKKLAYDAGDDYEGLADNKEMYSWMIWNDTSEMKNQFGTQETYTDYVSKVYATYKYLTNDDVETYEGFLSLFLSIHTNNAIPGVTTTYLGGTNTGSIWPVNLKSKLSGSSYSLVFSCNGLEKDSGISGLSSTNNPAAFPENVSGRKSWYMNKNGTVDSLDTQFINNVITKGQTYFESY